MLINKYRAKFGTTSADQAKNQIIKEEVVNLMLKESVNEQLLNEVEKRIKSRIEALSVQNPEEQPVEGRRNSQDSRVSGRSLASNISRQSKMLKSSQSVKSGLSYQSRTTLASNNDGADLTDEAWVDIINFNTTMYQMEQDDLKRKKAQGKIRMKEELERQVA